MTFSWISFSKNGVKFLLSHTKRIIDELAWMNFWRFQNYYGRYCSHKKKNSVFNSWWQSWRTKNVCLRLFCLIPSAYGSSVLTRHNTFFVLCTKEVYQSCSQNHPFAWIGHLRTNLSKIDHIFSGLHEFIAGWNIT